MKRVLKDAEISSGNVYKDLGFDNALEMKAKAKLVAQIGQVLKDRKLTQVDAAKIMGINQPKVSALLKGQFDGYSQERLIGFLNKLGYDIKIILKPHRQIRAGKLTVVFG